MSETQRGWLALACIPLCIVPALAAAALFGRQSDFAVAVTVILGMYGILLGIPVLLGVAIDAFRGPRMPRPRSRTALGVHTILIVAHDVTILLGGIQRCSRGDFPYWLIGYIPLLLYVNVLMFGQWRKLALAREGALLPRRS
jgi:hypothetical protein